MHLAQHPSFVVLSILIAWFGAWTALDLFRRTDAHEGHWRRAWMIAAGVAMGLSIWSMHFIAMLGFNPGSPVRYDVSRTIWSLVLAVAVTTYAFATARASRTQQIASGALMGAGICGMHYLGMAAIITSAVITNDPVFVALALLIAVFASTGAIQMAIRRTTPSLRMAAAIVLGFAVVGMHFTGMLGVRVSSASSPSVHPEGLEPFVLAIGVAAGTAFILLLALIAALADRRFQAVGVREALRSENQLRAILDHLPLGIFVATANPRKILFANAEASRLLGRDIDKTPPWSDTDGFGSVDADGNLVPADERLLSRAMRANERIGPIVQGYRRRDGSTMQLEVTAVPILDEDGRSTLAVAAFQDVTAKLEAEAQVRAAATLRESEERFRLIAEQAPVMLWMCDLHAREFYLNRMMREWHGLSRDDPQAAWARSAAAADRERLRVQFETALQANEGFTTEATFYRLSGEARIFHVVACPRFDDHHRFIGLIGVNTDITQTREAERRQQQLNELLEQRVSVALAEKADAEAALMHAQRLESLGRLTGGVAHDFNNLLTVVIGALDIILRDSENAERRTRLGEAALAAARRGERLTAQLLAFARRQPLQPETCDLNDLIRECEPLLRRAVGESIALHLELAPFKTTALIDRTQFEACLLNLVVNAVDASSPGGEIGIETQILPSAAREPIAERTICVSVWDRGHGMSAEVANQIFEPFYTTKLPGKGTGLGLSQVYGFVKQSGGEVQVDTKPGHGTCMKVLLPLQDADVQVVTPRAGARAEGGRPLRILLTEDDLSVAGITEAMLEELGHHVTCATNADQALQVLRADTALDVLLTDVSMPGSMNGVDLARAAVQLRPDLAVLLCSGYPGEQLDASIAHGEWPLLCKPYQQDELSEALLRVMAARTARAAHSDTVF